MGVESEWIKAQYLRHSWRNGKGPAPGWKRRKWVKRKIEERRMGRARSKARQAGYGRWFRQPTKNGGRGRGKNPPTGRGKGANLTIPGGGDSRLAGVLLGTASVGGGGHRSLGTSRQGSQRVSRACSTGKGKCYQLFSTDDSQMRGGEKERRSNRIKPFDGFSD